MMMMKTIKTIAALIVLIPAVWMVADMVLLTIIAERGVSRGK